MNRRELQETAIHESAHAIAAISLGVDVDTATIVPSREYLGVVWWAEHAEHAGDHDETVITLAGPVAARKFLGRWNHRGARTDRAEAKRLSPSPSAYRRAMRAAHALVESRWKEIKFVAEALLREQTLSGAEICGLIGFNELDDPPPDLSEDNF